MASPAAAAADAIPAAVRRDGRVRGPEKYF